MMPTAFGFFVPTFVHLQHKQSCKQPSCVRVRCTVTGTQRTTAGRKQACATQVVGLPLTRSQFWLATIMNQRPCSAAPRRPVAMREPATSSSEMVTVLPGCAKFGGI
jgi:hypothetical protein